MSDVLLLSRVSGNRSQVSAIDGRLWLVCWFICEGRYCDTTLSDRDQCHNLLLLQKIIFYHIYYIGKRFKNKQKFRIPKNAFLVK